MGWYADAPSLVKTLRSNRASNLAKCSNFFPFTLAPFLPLLPSSSCCSSLLLAARNVCVVHRFRLRNVHEFRDATTFPHFLSRK